MWITLKLVQRILTIGILWTVYLYIYAPQGGAVGPGGEGRGQHLSHCCQGKHTDTLVISEQCCLLDCYCLTVRSQPARQVLCGAGINFRVASVSSTCMAGFFSTVILLVVDQSVVQSLHPLSSLAVDSISCMNSHCQVLEKSIASSQTPEPNFLSWRVLLTWWWNVKKLNLQETFGLIPLENETLMVPLLSSNFSIRCNKTVWG